MSLSLSAILIPYGLFLALVAVFSLVNIGNFTKFGASKFVDFAVTFVYLVGAAVILFVTWQLLQGVDWQTPLTFNLPTSIEFAPQ